MVECHENDPKGALDRIPRNARWLYLHAYQALVWNRAVSKRFEAFGSAVLVGDLVMLPKGERGNAVPMAEADEPPAPPEEREKGEGEDDKEGDGPPNPERWTSKRRDKLSRLAYVESEEEAAKFTLFDVVMPVPGHDIPMPR